MPPLGFEPTISAGERPQTARRTIFLLGGIASPRKVCMAYLFMHCCKYFEVFLSVKCEKYLKQPIWADHVKKYKLADFARLT
jgi:hypothetical protein